MQIFYRNSEEEPMTRTMNDERTCCFSRISFFSVSSPSDSIFDPTQQRSKTKKTQTEWSKLIFSLFFLIQVIALRRKILIKERRKISFFYMVIWKICPCDLFDWNSNRQMPCTVRTKVMKILCGYQLFYGWLNVII